MSVLMYTVHKKTISVTLAYDDQGKVKNFGKIPKDLFSIKKLMKQPEKSGKLSFVMKQGRAVTVYRKIVRIGHTRIAVATSLIPQRLGKRVKTDRKNAEYPRSCYVLGG